MDTRRRGVCSAITAACEMAATPGSAASRDAPTLGRRRGVASARSALPRFIGLYGALFAAFGVASPFLPGLLSERGLDAVGARLRARARLGHPPGVRPARRPAGGPPRRGAGRAGGRARRLRRGGAGLRAGARRCCRWPSSCGARRAARTVDPDRRRPGAGRRRARAGSIMAGCAGPGRRRSSSAAPPPARRSDGSALGVIVWLNAGLLAVRGGVRRPGARQPAGPGRTLPGGGGRGTCCASRCSCGSCWSPHWSAAATRCMTASR